MALPKVASRMKQTISEAKPVKTDFDVETQDAGFKPLSRQEAQALRKRLPRVSPWWVILVQIVAGAVCAVLASLVTGRSSAAWSAGYGALCVVVPAAVFARGLTGRLSTLGPSAAVLAFFVWEAVKLVLTVAMLFAAPKLITGLSWPAMLVGLIVAMQGYWVAVVFAPKPPVQ
jgi:ATP synthase protein I